MSIKKDRKKVDSLFEELLKKSENLDPNQIYNTKDDEEPFLLQYYQLIEYIKFRNDLNTYIKGWSLSEDSNNVTQIFTGNNQHLFQQKLCLIDKKWIQKWRKHVGYEEIKDKFHKYGYKLIDNNDNYKWIIPIIEKNYKDNLLHPLDNKGIYNENNEVIPDSDFELISNDSYKLFSIGSKKTMDITNCRLLHASFLNEKYIVIFNNTTFWIVFKEQKLQIQFEIIVQFGNVSEQRKILWEELVSKDINDWVNEIGFNLYSDLESKKIIHGCELIIINKTLKYKQKENTNSNNIIPNLQNNRFELLNENKVISNDTLISIKNQFMNNLEKLNFKNTNTVMISENKNSSDNNDNFQKTNLINSNSNIYQDKNKNINSNIDKNVEENINGIIQKNENNSTQIFLKKEKLVPQNDTLKYNGEFLNNNGQNSSSDETKFNGSINTVFFNSNETIVGMNKIINFKNVNNNISKNVSNSQNQNNNNNNPNNIDQNNININNINMDSNNNYKNNNPNNNAFSNQNNNFIKNKDINNAQKNKIDNLNNNLPNKFDNNNQQLNINNQISYNNNVNIQNINDKDNNMNNHINIINIDSFIY